MRPKLLDLYCCEGGASEGFSRAGFDVYGIDLFKYVNDKGKRVGHSQKKYPFPSRQMDVLSLLDYPWSPLHFNNGESLYLRDFAAFGASPPCWKYSITNHNNRDYPDLINATRFMLQTLGRPYVIENVIGAPLRDPIELCGCMFDLKAKDEDGVVLHMWRQRQFESNVTLEQPRPGRRKLRGSTLEVHAEAFHDHEWVGGSYGGARRDKYEAKYVRKGGYVPPIRVQQELLGIDWMTQAGMHQSIPPVFTEFIGRQLLKSIDTHTDLADTGIN